ncbi:MAG: aminotransferase class I/II-fold pyridoxal phosphate-dependent enzyme [Spirochaetes bacterium]|jgi:dTDP-4-amino-4,6-dideoxygalactose transaminase|nr:aminotransferase class I/II-fold pyridoxal phosphate-dependent enzyme [Spirochaetota bacterium]
MSRSTDFVPFSKPDIGPAEEAAALRVLRSGWLTTAGEARAFEAEFAEAVGKPHALAVSSATAGLHLALEAVGVGPGDLVAMSPYTFAATAEVVRYLGAHPLFVDIEEDGYNIDPERLETAIASVGEQSAAGRRGESERPPGPPRGPVRAVVPVHVAGRPCDMPRIGEIAARAGAAVVSDAAHTLLTADGTPVGAEGDAAAFSFYATKPITTGEGGMVVTDRADLAERMRVMRLHGIDRDVWDRYTSQQAGWAYAVTEAGFKYNMPDLAAAIGRVQLEKAGEMQARRREIAERYRAGLGDLEWLTMPCDHPLHCYHLFILQLDLERLSIDRDGLITEMREAGIGTSVHFIPLHVMPYYRRLYGYTEHSFPVSWNRFARAVSLPIYSGLTDEQVDRVIHALRAVGERHSRIAP